MRSVLERMARAGHAPLHTRSPQDARVAYEAGAGVLEVPKTPLVRVEDLQIPARDGAMLPARLYAPSTDMGLPVLLYTHGGGFTIGNIATHDILCRELARLAGCMVVSLDYRLAPEYRFPTASNDAWDALQWLAANAERLGGGKGSDILEHPLNAVVWLAGALAQEGLAMQPGDLISLGSFSALLPPKAGLSVTATYDGLPGAAPVRLSFK